MNNSQNGNGQRSRRRTQQNIPQQGMPQREMPPREMSPREMSPRDRYFAAQREAAENERRRLEEAARLEAERAKQAEMERQKRMYEEKLRRKKENDRIRRKQKAKVFRARMFLFLACFVLIFSVSIISILISFNKTNGSDEDGMNASKYKFVYVFGKEKDEYMEWTQSKASTVCDGEVYINFSKLADALSMAVTGSGNEKRYVTSNGLEEVRFTYGSEIAEINSKAYRMTGKVIERDSNMLFVPISFITDAMTGIKVENDAENAKYTLTLMTDIEVAFLMKAADTADTVKEESEYGETTLPPETDAETDAPYEDEIPAVDFKSDLPEYEEYMDPQNENRDAYLVLVNSWNLLGENDDPTDLVEVINTRNDGRKTQKLRLYAAKALEALFIELYANGYDGKGPSGYPVSVMSAYRSYSYQKQLFNSYVEREMKDDPSLTRAEAEAITEKYSARPGTSEHQTGLCIDMHNLSSAQKAFANEDAYEWLVENCWKFGFILRFPDGKTDVTGITYEPWHYRYVGRYHAYKIMSEGLTLEEYVAGLNG